MAKKSATKVAKKKAPAKKAVAKKSLAKKKPPAKKPAANKHTATGAAHAKAKGVLAGMTVIRAATAFDWKSASQGSLANGAKLLGALVEGKPAAQHKAYDELSNKVVGRPIACVVAPFLVDLAVAGGARALCLRLLAAIRDHAPESGTRSEQRLTRATDPIVAHVPAFLRDGDPAVRAAAALVAGAFVTARPELTTALASESDVRANACMVIALDDVASATPLLADGDPRMATAAACVLARPDAPVAGGVIDQLERALADDTLDEFPFPDRSLRSLALTRLAALAQPALRARLAAIYGELLDQPPWKLAAVALMDLAFATHEDKTPLSPFEQAALRQLVESKKTSTFLTQRAPQYNLPTDLKVLRRLAGVRQPVPEGWVLGVELSLDGISDSAVGFWMSYLQTGVGDARAIANAIADALSPASCAEAVLEGCKLGTGQYFDHDWKAPPLPPGGVLGAKKGWGTWTVYKTRAISEVADAYEKLLVGGGFHLLGRTDQPDDLRLTAIRDGIEVDATIYFNADDGTYVLADGYPELFTTFVDAALARHGAAFVDAYAAIIRTMSTPAGKKRVEAFDNVGYYLPKAALLIAQRTGAPPDPGFDELVVQHQGNANVLLAGHIGYLWAVPDARRNAMVVALGKAGKADEIANAMKARALN